VAILPLLKWEIDLLYFRVARNEVHELLLIQFLHFSRFFLFEEWVAAVS
jgi:hypothetical protein